MHGISRERGCALGQSQNCRPDNTYVVYRKCYITLCIVDRVVNVESKDLVPVCRSNEVYAYVRSFPGNAAECRLHCRPPGRPFLLGLRWAIRANL